MFVSIHTELVEKIKNSKSLKAKLSDAQIQKFIARAIELPPEGQTALVKLLDEEEHAFFLARAEALELWAGEVELNLEHSKKAIRQEKEQETKTQEMHTEDTLIQQLQNL